MCLPVDEFGINLSWFATCIVCVFFFSWFVFFVVIVGLLCHRDDACISNPCRAGSQCDTNPVTGMYNCNCPTGYMGSTCNIDRNECSIGKGENCLNSISLYLTFFKYVVCFFSFFFSPYLTIFFLSLTSGPNPCEHGGQCVNTDGSFTCNCGRGYTGPRCEQDVNECASSPCQNDGTCLDRIGEYTCICMSGMIHYETLFYSYNS